MRPNQRRNRGLELGVLLLINEIFSLGFEAIPPITLFTVIGQILLYVGIVDVPWDKYDVCISGTKVWTKLDWRSFVLSSFEHGDDMHLYYNMISFLVKGRTLEAKYGSANFALLLSILCLMTPGIYVLLAVLGYNCMDDYSIMKSCAIGFSGVIFALKVLTTIESGGHTYIQGFRVPVKYSAWVELLAIHVLVPNASFLGHLAGVLAGVIYMKTFIGSIIDFVITSITGQPMRHTIAYNNSYEYTSSRQYSNFSRPPEYGWRQDW